jgi:hypothetical protein
MVGAEKENINMLKNIFHKHKLLWSQKSFRLSAFLSLIFLLASLLANYAGNLYASLSASNYVSDLILDNLPVVNIDFMFFEGFGIFILFIVYFLIKEPQKIPFTIKSIAVFILIRSISISLTHLAVPPDHSPLDNIFRGITFENDLFFSSHTGLPFLMALNFWENKRVRLIFILISLIFGASVLLGHIHYSIDVFAAFFITYGIFHITRNLFSKNYALSLEK